MTVHIRCSTTSGSCVTCTVHSPTGASISPGPGVSKWPGPGFPYYYSKAGAIEAQNEILVVEGQVIPQMKALAE